MTLEEQFEEKLSNFKIPQVLAICYKAKKAKNYELFFKGMVFLGNIYDEDL